MRDTLHRWAIIFYTLTALSLAAWRHVRRAKHRRKWLRKVEAWPW